MAARRVDASSDRPKRDQARKLMFHKRPGKTIVKQLI